MRKFVKKNIYSLVIYIALGIFALLLVTYRINFDGGLSNSREVWGQFGDFLGGTLNPILGFATVIILVLTLKTQRKELKESRKAIKDNNTLIKSQLETIRSQALENTFFRLLEDFEKDPSVLKAKAEPSSLHVFFTCYSVKDFPIASDEASDIFMRQTNGLHIGEFRYVIIEKFATLISLACKLSDSDIHLKLLQTAAGLGLTNSVIHHSLIIDEEIYASLTKGKDVLRGLGVEWIYDERVAKDFLDKSSYEDYCSNQDIYLQKFQSSMENYWSSKKTAD